MNQIQLIKVWKCIFPIFIDTCITAVLYMIPALQTQPVLCAGICGVIMGSIIIPIYIKDQKTSCMNNRIYLQKNIEQNVLKWILIILLGMSVCLLLTLLTSLISLYLIKESSTGSYTEVSKTIFASNFLIQILFVGIIVPISEEFMFRGITYKRMRNMGFSFMKAALISSVLFGLFHGNFIQMISGIAAGLIICYIYEQMKNIIAPILFHMIFNSTSIILSQLNIQLPDTNKAFVYIILDLIITGCFIYSLKDSKKNVDK